MILAKKSNVTLSCGTEQSKYNRNEINWNKIEDWTSSNKVNLT